MDIAQVLGVSLIGLIPDEKLLSLPETAAEIPPQFSEAEVALLVKDRRSEEQE
ncbi:MAG: hypothetical protein HC921_14160 [Synechococcaceae cyanobacterium SM2_3_1]|nr:hypothetical protein [Synechococcaceae cyanobacterium SM2_3_1]